MLKTCKSIKLFKYLTKLFILDFNEDILNIQCYYSKTLNTNLCKYIINKYGVERQYILFDMTNCSYSCLQYSMMNIYKVTNLFKYYISKFKFNLSVILDIYLPFNFKKTIYIKYFIKLYNIKKTYIIKSNISFAYFLMKKYKFTKKQLLYGAHYNCDINFITKLIRMRPILFNNCQKNINYTNIFNILYKN